MNFAFPESHSLLPDRVYDRLKRDIREGILSGELKQGERLKGVLPLSTKYSLSKDSVCKALDELAAEGLIHKQAGKGVFVADIDGAGDCAARNLDILMVFGADPRKRYAPDQQRLGAIDALAPTHSRLHVHHQEWSTNRQATHRYLLDNLTNRKMDGIVMHWHVPFFLPVLAKVPIVFSNMHQPPSYYERTCQVNISDIECAYIAVSRLIKLNHRRIGLISPLARYGQNHPSHGYAVAMRDAFLEVREDWILDKADVSDANNVHCQVRSFFESQPDITAIYVSDDYLGAVVLNVLIGMDKSIPEDISLITFANKGNCPVWPRELSRVEIDQYGFGRACGEAMLKLISGELQPGTCHAVQPACIEGETARAISDSC